MKNENSTNETVIITKENGTAEKDSSQRELSVGIGGAIIGAGLGTVLSSFTRSEDIVDMEIEDECISDEGTSDTSHDQSFDEAFANARAEQGAGGTFEYDGNLYNTNYKEEMEFIQSDDEYTSSEVADIDTPLTTSNKIQIDLDKDGIYDYEVEISELIDNSLTHNTSKDLNTSPEYGVLDLDQNGQIDVLAVDQNNDGIADIIAMDINSNGIVDTIAFGYTDTNDIDVMIVDREEDGFDDNDRVIEVDDDINMDSFIEYDIEEDEVSELTEFDDMVLI